jgi:hypothetical protein
LHNSRGGLRSESGALQKLRNLDVPETFIESLAPRPPLESLVIRFAHDEVHVVGILVNQCRCSSVAVAVGFIALTGVAAETGVFMLIYLDRALKERRARELYIPAFSSWPALK